MYKKLAWQCCQFMRQKSPIFCHHVSRILLAGQDDRPIEQVRGDESAVNNMRRTKMSFIKRVNDALYFTSTGLGLCVVLHVGDPSQIIVAQGVVNAMHSIGQRIEQRIDKDEKQ